jgi:NADH-quinone oxidoreductase subunit J
VDNISFLVLFFGIVAVASAIVMLLQKNPLSAALAFLLTLLSTAAIYGVIGEHLLATLQVIVYAGAIMVLFVFSIMLLNMSAKHNAGKPLFKKWAICIAIPTIVSAIVFCVLSGFYEAAESNYTYGQWTQEFINVQGGNTRVLSMELFTSHFLAFEVVGVALLIATVGAVILAKRKID